MNSLAACSQFINLIPEVVPFRAAQLVTQLLKPLQTGQALLPSLGRNVVEPPDKRYRVRVFPVVEDVNACQWAFLHVLIIGNACQDVGGCASSLGSSARQGSGLWCGFESWRR